MAIPATLAVGSDTTRVAVEFFGKAHTLLVSLLVPENSFCVRQPAVFLVLVEPLRAPLS
jgi:hypothetical protein